MTSRACSTSNIITRRWPQPQGLAQRVRHGPRPDAEARTATTRPWISCQSAGDASQLNEQVSGMNMRRMCCPEVVAAASECPRALLRRKLAHVSFPRSRAETVPDESCQRVTKRLADLRGRRRGTVCAAARRMACRHRAKTVPPRAVRCRCAPPPPLLKESSRLLHIALGLTSTTPQDHLALASRKSLLTALLS